MPSWLPLAQADRLIWLQNFVLKLAVYVGTAGITAADVTFATGVRDAYSSFGSVRISLSCVCAGEG